MKIQRNNPDPQKTMLGQILVELGFITESTLAQVLAESTGVEKFDPKTTVLDPNIVKQLPKNVATRHKVIPVMQEDNTIFLAMADIYNVLAMDQVQRYFPRNFKIVPLYCPEGEVMDLIDNYYDYEMSIDGILREIETGMSSDENKITGEAEGYVNPTVRLVDALLIDAIKRGASDIHFEPEPAFVRVRYRIDGNLQQIRSFHKDYWSAIAVRMKIISSMNIAETRNPQDGRITYNVLGREVDFRVSSQPTIHGENFVLRILDKKKALVPLESLGMHPNNVAILKKLIKRPEGIIIVTGPTGSGKTTTLYSILNFINAVDVNIMTLEDPVEYQLSMIRQSNIRAASGMGFAEGLRAIMRQDPDVIFVGEIRDHETAEMALRASMTGHQVYSTLHTNDAMGAIPRLIDIGIKPQLLAGAIICVIAQRLARKLCPECAESRVATPEECHIMSIDPTKAPMIKVHKGCEACGYTGYKGRVSVTEILPVDKELDELIATSATRHTMLEHLRKHGFKTMQEDGIGKVLDGITDLEELISTIDMTERL
ncbi:MAG: type II/IV secretion system protein [Proteobacteria bacterium]|nr:type II/IV secretion system protein [Pseudomonadota bacterium]